MFGKMLCFTCVALLLFMLVPAIAPTAKATDEDFVVVDGEPMGFNAVSGEVEPIDGVSATESSIATIVYSDTDGIFINLNEESITLNGFTVAAYSIDGGVKWKKGALPAGKKFSKLFDKESTIWLCSEVDKKKKPTENAVIVRFPTINARPKADKLAPLYTETSWFLVKKRSEDKITSGYEFAVTADKKTAKDGQWFPIDEDGILIGTGKTRTTYLIRIPVEKNGNTYTPASKAVKLTPANYGKAPNMKIKSRTKVLKLKKGQFFQIDDAPINEVTEKYTELDFNVYMGDAIAIWTASTGKKPPSEKQIITLNRRG